MDKGGLVVLGCGSIAQRHAAAARRLGRPLIFASRNVDPTRRYARGFGVVTAYGSYAEALADPRAAGAIICTPHDRHLADARAAFADGNHVLIEKPLARTPEEADNRGRLVIAHGEGGPRLWHFRHDRRGYEAMLAAFVHSMSDEGPVEMHAAEGRADLAVVLSAYRSMAERCVVDVEPVGLARC